MSFRKLKSEVSQGNNIKGLLLRRRDSVKTEATFNTTISLDTNKITSAGGSIDSTTDTWAAFGFVSNTDYAHTNDTFTEQTGVHYFYIKYKSDGDFGDAFSSITAGGTLDGSTVPAYTESN